MLIRHGGLPHHETHRPRSPSFFVEINKAGRVDQDVSRINHSIKDTLVPRIDTCPVKTHLGWGNGVGPTPDDKRRWRNDVPIAACPGYQRIRVHRLLGTDDVSILQHHLTCYVLFEATKLFS